MLNANQQQLQTQIHKALANKQLTTAHTVLVKRIQQNPSDHFSYFLLSQVNITAGDINKAIKLIEKALSFAVIPLYHLHLAKYYLLTNEQSLACKYYHLAKAYNDYSASDSDTLANIATRLGFYDQALQHQQQAYNAAPTNHQIAYNLAIAYKIHGQFQQAKQLLNSIIKAQADFMQAHYSLAELNSPEQAEQHLVQLQSMAVPTAPRSQQLYYHAIALNFEHLENYQHAFAFFTKSKHAIAPQLNYDASQHQQFCQTLITQSNLCKLAVSDSEFAPIFVVGIPRSGTTLMEKILNQSPEVAGIGELNDIAQLLQKAAHSHTAINSELLQKSYKLSFNNTLLSDYQQRALSLTNNKRSCDKQPFNFYYIDFILAAYPKAKIICMKREEKDGSIANFRQLYQPQSVFHHYSFALDDIIAYHRDYCMLINHFATKYPNNVMIQQYEDLVLAPKQQTQQIFSFCNLTWQPDCLTFYQNNAASATASKKQIRQPLNNRSIGYWQHYQPYYNFS